MSWLALSHTSTAAEVVRFGANESPPYWTATLPRNGMGGEILHAISEEAGLESAIEFAPLSRLIQDDTNNDLGNPVFYMGHQDYAVIIPILIYYDALFFYQKDAATIPEFKSLKELEGNRIGALKGTVSGQYYFKQIGITLEESYSRESLFKKLRLGRLDICIEIDLVGQDMISKTLPDHATDFFSILVPGSAQPLAIMIDADDPNAQTLGRLYREGLKRIIENGKYQSILEKYYGNNPVPASWYSELRKFGLMYDFGESE
ncbi:MAG: transporter substrate-binding domain-containing protein [Sedimenticola sp.]